MKKQKQPVRTFTATDLVHVRGGVTFSPWITRNKKGDGSTVDNPADMAG